jgi:hypothetical protein
MEDVLQGLFTKMTRTIFLLIFLIKDTIRRSTESHLLGDKNCYTYKFDEGGCHDQNSVP